MPSSRPIVFVALLVLGLAISPIGLARSPATSPTDTQVTLPQVSGFPVAALDHALWNALPRVTVEATSHGETAQWEGVPLHALLLRLGAPGDTELRGPGLSRILLLTAADEYRVAFALADFDPAFGNLPALLADRRNGESLDATHGPLQLILPQEKRAGRWIRQVRRIELITLPSGNAD